MNISEYDIKNILNNTEFISKVQIKTGDIIVIKIKSELPLEKLKKIEQNLQEKIFPDNKILVLDNCVESFNVIET